MRAFAATLGRIDRIQMAAYVLASLASAFAGSLAAVLLVPLIQPSSALPFGGALLGAHRSIEAQAVLFAAATGAFALSRWLAACLRARLAARYGLNLRRQVHARLVDARLPSLADSTSSEIANVLTYNVEITVNGFSAVLQLLIAGVTTAVTLAFAFWVSPSLVLALPVFAAFGWMTFRLFGREQSRISRQYVADMTRLFWRGEDFPRRLRHIRSFGRQQAEQASYAGLAARLSHGYRRQQELAAYGRLVLELLAAVGIAAAFVLAYRWRGIDQASLIAVCLLLGRLLPYLVSARQGVQQLRSAIPAFELWRRYMSLETVRPPPATGLRCGTGVHIKCMRLVPPRVALDIRDLVLVPGELTLVFGDSGIGKSCLVDALSGMVEPRRFAACVDGRPIDFDGYRALVHRSAYVSQQVRPWHPCVRDCLYWAAPGATESMLWDALAAVGLDRRLAGAAKGLDTALDSSAARLSGGELQRLLLAQVLLRQPVLAVLDEATGALDSASEEEVLAVMQRRLPHTMLIVVSHRTALAAMADQVLTIDRGRGVSVMRRPRSPAAATPRTPPPPRCWTG